MPRSNSSFPLSRGIVIVCSSLQVVLSIMDAVTRLNHPQFSLMHWLFPSIMFACGFAGLLAQSPRSNPLLRPLVVGLNIGMFGLAGCGLLAVMSLLKFDNLQQPYLLLLFSLLAVVPGWINLIALSMLPHTRSEGPLY